MAGCEILFFLNHTYSRGITCIYIGIDCRIYSKAFSRVKTVSFTTELNRTELAYAFVQCTYVVVTGIVAKGFCVVRGNDKNQCV